MLWEQDLDNLKWFEVYLLVLFLSQTGCCFCYWWSCSWEIALKHYHKAFTEL